MKFASRWALWLVVPLAVAVGTVLFSGCEDKDHDPDGTITITGNVKDYHLGQTVQAGAVQGVLVVLEPGGYEAESDGNGNFVFNNIPAGTYTITFYFNGQQASYPLTVKDGKTYALLNVVVDENGNVHLTLRVTPGEDKGDEYGAADLAGTWNFTITGGPLPAGHGTGNLPGVVIDASLNVAYGAVGALSLPVAPVAFQGTATVNGDGDVNIDVRHLMLAPQSTTAYFRGQLGHNVLNGVYIPTMYDAGGVWNPITTTVSYPFSAVRISTEVITVTR